MKGELKKQLDLWSGSHRKNYDAVGLQGCDPLKDRTIKMESFSISKTNKKAPLK